MRVNPILMLVFAIGVCGIAQAEKQPFDRYQPILDRQMFGQLPPGFDPTKPPSEVTKTNQKELSKEQEQLKSAIHFSVINITPDGETAVGFTDNSDPKAPVHYYLKVGEKRNGWEVQEADPQAATMTIAKGEIVVSLELGANSAKTAGATSAAKPASTGIAGRPSLLGGRQAVGNGATAAAGAPASRFGGGLRVGMGAGSFRERRAQREAEQRARAEEAAAKAKADEEKREAEREANRQELQSLKDELKAQREAAERDRQERERKDQEEKDRREREAQESADKSDNAENDA